MLIMLYGSKLRINTKFSCAAGGIVLAFPEWTVCGAGINVGLFWQWRMWVFKDSRSGAGVS